MEGRASFLVRLLFEFCVQYADVTQAITFDWYDLAA